MPEENDTPTRHEHESLKETLQTFVGSTERRFSDLSDIIANQGKTFHTELSKQEERRIDDVKGLHKAISQVDTKRQGDSKISYPLLGLVLSVILAVGAVLNWNMSRIETRVEKLATYEREQEHVNIANHARIDEKTKEIKRIQVLQVKKTEELQTLTQFEFGRLSALRKRYQDDIEDLDSTRDVHKNELMNLTATVSALEEKARFNGQYIKELDEKGSRRLIEDKVNN